MPPLRPVLLLGLSLLLFASGCPASTVPPAPSPPLSLERETAGLRYLERLSGGARPDERLPMIIALHPMGGDPASLLELFQGYRGRARFIVPFGHPSGGLYAWDDAIAPDADRIAAALPALLGARPTLGKPIVTGFSQGGMLSFALAAAHPQAIAAAFPVGGLLPPALYPSAAQRSEPRPATLPPVIAFHGADDLAVPTQDALASIEELKRVGYTAELHTYQGLAHDISPEEIAEVMQRIGRAAEALTAPAP